jgi:hypothetical protein
MLSAPLAMAARWVGIPLTAAAVKGEIASVNPMPVITSGAAITPQWCRRPAFCEDEHREEDGGEDER